MNDPYQTLGVEPTATAEDIKRAHRRKALEHHPDRGGDADAFREIQAAAELLGDDERRARYDSTGDTDQYVGTSEVERQVLAMVGTAFCQTEIDPIRWMEEQIDAERQRYASDKLKIAAAITRMEKNLQKFESRKCKKNEAGKALVTEGARANIAAAKRDHAAAEAGVKLATEKLALLSGLGEGSIPRHRDSWPFNASFHNLRSHE
ncbi:MAG: J domain-containing protein [Planctomycetales bacterium]|nr:J domain-containing protein [Planctomycetales bacterium]